MMRLAEGIAILLLILAAGYWTIHGLQLRAELTELRAEYDELQALTGIKGRCQTDEFRGVVCWDDNDHPKTITNAESIANELHTEFPATCQRKD